MDKYKSRVESCMAINFAISLMVEYICHWKWHTSVTLITIVFFGVTAEILTMYYSAKAAAHAKNNFEAWVIVIGAMIITSAAIILSFIYIFDYSWFEIVYVATKLLFIGALAAIYDFVDCEK